MTEPTFADMVATLSKLSERSHEVATFEVYGEHGVVQLVQLLDTCRRVLEHVPFEMMTAGFTVYVSATEAFTPTGLPGMTLPDPQVLAGKPTDRLTVFVSQDGQLHAWDDGAEPFSGGDPVLAYKYVHGTSEVVVVDGQEWSINDSGWPCAMATPSFSKLEEALDHYIRLNRRPDRCLHLKQTWREDARLGLLPKPEHLMRDSLFAALRYSLKSATVRPELNQDETKPVDLEITWFAMNRSAIIEIKWMGDSAPEGTPSDFATKYRDARAIEGLRQLADYLDRRDGISPDVPVIGYLFVFDARRRSLTPSQTSIGVAHGMHYAMRDVTYPQELLDRPDMGRPFRCFMEPVCT